MEQHRYPRPKGFRMVPEDRFSMQYEHVGRLEDAIGMGWEAVRKGGSIIAKFVGNRYFAPKGFRESPSDRIYVSPVRNTLVFEMEGTDAAFARFKALVGCGDWDYWDTIEKWLIDG